MKNSVYKYSGKKKNGHDFFTSQDGESLAHVPERGWVLCPWTHSKLSKTLSSLVLLDCFEQEFGLDEPGLTKLNYSKRNYSMNHWH